MLLGPSSFALAEGERALLVGPSGSGKSLLLDVILGFVPHERPGLRVSGSLTLEGRELVGAPVEARIHDIEDHGAEKILTLRVGETFLRATAPARIAFGIDEAVRLSWNSGKVLLFDRQSGMSLRHQI